MAKQANGGKARAAKLTADQRSAIAKKAAEARWADRGTASLVETHSGAIQVGEEELTCAVLNDGTRVFSGRGLDRAFGSKRRGGRYQVETEGGAAQLPRFLASEAIISRIDNDLMMLLTNPISYVHKGSNTVATGYEATTLPKICAAIIDAERDGALKSNQNALVTQAHILIRAFSQVGVVALVDEATGYQAEREKDELQKLLKVYLSEEALKWVKTFPDEFFTQIYRLRGWRRPIALNKHTQFMGNVINELVYERLPEGVLEELRKKNPRDYETGNRKHKHHQFLSEDVGHPHLKAHLQKVIGLLQASLSWIEFKRLFGRVFFPNAGTQQPLGLDD